MAITDNMKVGPRRTVLDFQGSVKDADARCLEAGEEAKALLTGNLSLLSALETVKTAHQQQLPSLLGQVTTVGREVLTFAAEFQGRCSHVKHLNDVLVRVEEALAVAESLLQMKLSCSEVSGALASRNIHRAVELIAAYEAAEASLGDGKAPHKADGSGESVADAKLKCLEMLRSEASQAQEAGDKEKVSSACTLLAQLGDITGAVSVYCSYVSRNTFSPLNTMVSVELEKMNSLDAAQSHLVLLSRVLDEIAGTYEMESSTVFTTFGAEGCIALLSTLHEDGTNECVPIAADFVSRRKDIATLLDNALQAAPLSLPASQAMVARQADQLLEESCHIASCCAVYLNFFNKTMKELKGTNTGEEEEGDSDPLWDSQTNGLLVKVQSILSVYCPTQMNYFRLAFSQAVAVQKGAVDTKVGGKPDPVAEGRLKSMGFTLSNVYERASPEVQQQLRQHEKVYEAGNVITLPDDVFYVLRTAVLRAFNTRSAQIVFAVLSFIADVVRDLLVVELESHMKMIMQQNSFSFAPATVLRWAAAALTCVLYTNRLAGEVKRHATAAYRGGVLKRVLEQCNDLSISASALDGKVELWLTTCAEASFRGFSVPHLSSFEALDFLVDEDQLYDFEENDSWCALFLDDCSSVLTRVKQLLDPSSFDRFLVKFASLLMKSLQHRMHKKKLNAFGALHLDKDLRAMRTLLSHFAVEVSLRECYAPLVLTTSLLLVDKPRDALDEAQNTVLSAEEKRRVLLQRVDLDEAEVLALKL